MAGSSHNITSLYSCFAPLTDKEWATVMLDFEKYANHHVIVDKNGNAVKMKLNNAQKVVAELILKYAMAEIPRPIKLVIHKCRQAGISTVLSLIEKYIASRKTKINILHMLPTEELARNFWREKGEPLWQGSDPALLPTVQATGTPTPYIQVKEYHNVQMGVNIRYNGSNSKSAMRSSTNQVVILDECFTPETEVLTEHGWVRFDRLEEEKVAQWSDGMIEYVQPLRKVKKPHNGLMYDVSFGGTTLRMTPNHELLFKSRRSGKLEKKTVAKSYFNDNWLVAQSGVNKAMRQPTVLERIGVMLQADGAHIHDNNIRYRGTSSWKCTFRKLDKIARCTELLNEAKLKYSTCRCKSGNTKFTIQMPNQLNYKRLDAFLTPDIDIIDEAMNWDGYVYKNGTKYYSSKVKENVDFMSSVATQCGYRAHSSVQQDGRSDNYSDIYRLYMNRQEWRTSASITKVTSNYNGYVYCVTVPSGCIVVRNGAEPLVTGNCAFFENVRRLEKGVLATQPKTGMAITVYVSTANGMNHFYDAVKQAQTPNSGMEYIFLPWHMLDEYERPISKESRFYDLERYKPSAFDMKMFDIFEKAGYPKSHWLNKLEWYDHVLASEAKGDRDYMASEYPSTPEESFRASGRPVLPLKVINYWLKQNHPYTAIAPVAKTDRNTRTLKVKFEEDSNSPVRRYIEPIPGHRYMIGVDCAEGYSGDMSAGVIFDVKTLEEVASFVVDYEQNDLAELVVDLAKYYNNAQIVPEKNMAGLFVESVQLLGYWNMFIDPEYHGPQTNKMYGIRTTLASKNEAINRLKFLMNQNLYKAHDLVFMNQAIHYSWKQLPSGGAKAEAVGQDDNGNPWHDDTIACRLTLMLALDFRRFKQYFKK